MKLALQRKASKKLVDRKDEVLAFVRSAAALAPPTVGECVSGLKELEATADDLGLPLTGDAWGERLIIKKKGGGMHFEDADLAAAAQAYMRLGVMHSAVTWHEQIVSRGQQITSAVGAFRTKGGSGASMSKPKILEKCTEILTNVRKTLHDIFNDGAFKSTTAEMARLGVPQALHEDANGLRTQALLLAEFAHELAHAELAGWRKEGKTTQKFRSPQTLAILTNSDTLMRAVDTVARPAAHVPSEQLTEIAEAIEELRASAPPPTADEELDDEI